MIARLSWTHILTLTRVEDRLKGEFYSEMRRIERLPQAVLERELQKAIRRASNWRSVRAKRSETG